MAAGAAENASLALGGLRFWKMTGSGNDFVVFDARDRLAEVLRSPDVIARLCDRRQGVGADGVVFIEPHATERFSIAYFNRDGSRGELCGNASLCLSNLAVQLGIVEAAGYRFSTDVGPISGRIVADEPEIDLQPAHGLRTDSGIRLEAGEERMGFVDTGVPHLVVLVPDAEAVDLMRRGAALRHHASLSAGANVNFVSQLGDRWRMRTYERGVEAETLACGTGSAASAILLMEWGLASGPSVVLMSTSGRPLTVTVGRSERGHVPSLRGEGRLVYSGSLERL